MIAINAMPDVRQDPDERRYLIWALGIVAACALANTAIALRGGLYADDLREYSRAAVDPWSLDWILGWETYRHLAPWERAHFSLFVEVAPLNHLFAAGLMAVELSIALTLFYFLARRLLDRGWALAALLLAATTPLLTATHAWLIQGVSLYGVLIGLHMAGLALLGFLDDHRRRWLVLAGAGWLIAAGTWETWLAGPPILFGLVMILLSEGSLEDRFLTTLRSAWEFWFLTAFMVAGFLAMWWLGDFGTGAELPSATSAVGAIWDFWTILLIPGFLGGPWDWYAGNNAYSPIAVPGQGRVVLAAVAFTALLAWAVSRRRGASLQGLGIFLGAVTLTVILPIIGRLSQYPEAVQREPRYVAPALTIAALGLVLILRALSAVPWTPRRRRVGILAVLAVVAGIVVTDVNFVRIWQRNPSPEYIATAREALATTDSAAGIFNTAVPDAVLSSAWFPDYANTMEFFRPMLRDDVARFGTADSRLMFDGTGALVAARFYPLTWAPLLACKPIERGRSTSVELAEAQVHEQDLTLRVEAFAQQEGTLLLLPSAGAGPQGETTPLTVPLNPGDNEAYVLLPKASIAEVTITSQDTFSCVKSVVVGQPAP